MGRQEMVSRTGQVMHRFPPCPPQERAELKIQGQELKAEAEQLARDRQRLDEAWQELRLEKEKVIGAARRVQQQEEMIRSTKEVSGASAPRFAAVHGLAPQPASHTPPEVVNPVPGGEQGDA